MPALVAWLVTVSASITLAVPFGVGFVLGAVARIVSFAARAVAEGFLAGWGRE